MAAIDPDATPEHEDDADTSKPSRSTLKIIRPPPGMDLDEDDEDYEDEEDESDEDSDDEEINGGPSDKEKAKKLREAAALKELEDAMEEDDSEGDGDIDIKAAISKLIKGKAPAMDDDEDDEDDESLELEEIVVCTLDPEKVRVECYVSHYDRTLLTSPRSNTNSRSTSPSPRASESSSR
jgi:FK506-binding nuclear protein